MSLGCGEWGLCLGPGADQGKITKARSPATTFIIRVPERFCINCNDVFII